MSKPIAPNVKAWLAEPMPAEVRRAIERLARAPDVRSIAVMPDVHLARRTGPGSDRSTAQTNSEL